MSEQDKSSIVDDKLPIAWGVVADAEIEGYKVFDERIITISKENHEQIEALQGLLTVLTKDHTDDNKDNHLEQRGLPLLRPSQTTINL